MLHGCPLASRCLGPTPKLIREAQTRAVSRASPLTVHWVCCRQKVRGGAADRARSVDCVVDIILRPLAHQGNSNAQFNFGLMYFKGNGVLQDYAEAVKWWRKAVT